MAEPKFLEAKLLTKRYGWAAGILAGGTGDERSAAVDDVSFDVLRGETLAIVGVLQGPEQAYTRELLAAVPALPA